MKRKSIYIVILTIGSIFAMVLPAFAHCATDNGPGESIITNFSWSITFPSRLKIREKSYQQWGAPYCYVLDRHTIQKKNSDGTYSTKISRYWTDTDSDWGVDHVWVNHEVTYDVSSYGTGTYRGQVKGYRIANHFAGIAFNDHQYDTDYSSWVSKTWTDYSDDTSLTL